MGSSISCVPQNNFQLSSKNFIRRNSSRLFRKKNPQEGQVKSNSIINILCTVTPRKEMSPKDLEAIENVRWDPPFAYDPSAGWKKSSMNVKNYGRMIHSSKVQFRFLHCQDIHDCFLDLFQTHLHFVSNTTNGPTYQGTLPLSDLVLCKFQCRGNETKPFAFQLSGVGLNPIIVYCSSQKDLDTWFGLLKMHIERNGGTVTVDEAKPYTRVKNPDCNMTGKEELRNSVKNEPIYEWEGSQRESLGPITCVSKVKLRHLPCEEQYDRLLVMYPSTIIILSEESNGLFYKGKLPLNSISVTSPCQDVKLNTFMIEGKLINPIIVTCPDKNEFGNWISHFNTMHVPVTFPPPPIYDIIYTPTKTKAAEFDRWGTHSSPEERRSQNGRGSHGLSVHNYMDSVTSPGYSTPLCFGSNGRESGEVGAQVRPSGRSNSISSQIQPVVDLQHRALPHYGSSTSTDMVQSPIYNTPCGPVECSAPFRQERKVPLVKSNSWSVARTAMTQQLSAPQRNSDVCTSRKKLPPLYDEPWTPGMHLQEDNYVKPAMSRQCCGKQEGASLLPPSFRLQTPPLGRHKTSPPHPRQEVTSVQKAGEFKLLSAPVSAMKQSRVTQPTHQLDVRGGLITGTPLDDSQEDVSYLKPAEPDDQELEYDNIWDFDCNNGMVQPLCRISPYRTSAK